MNMVSSFATHEGKNGAQGSLNGASLALLNACLAPSEVRTNIPEQLKALPIWVGWLVTENEETSKTRKIPIDPKTGKYAKANDSRTWGSFDQALDGCLKFGYHYPGIMFDGTGIMGIDIDHCISEDGSISAVAQEVIETIDSYTEKSPSGKGIHILTIAHKPEGGCRKGNIEMYDKGRGFTVTGHCIKNPGMIRERNTEVKLIHNKFLSANAIKEEVQNLQIPFTEAEKRVTDAALKSNHARRIEALLKGDISLYQSHSEADLALCSYLLRFSKGDGALVDSIYRKSGLYRSKWDESRGITTYGKSTIQKAISGYSAPNRIKGTSLEKRQSTVANADVSSACCYSTDDTGNARRLRDKFRGRISYSFVDSAWRIYDGKRWQIDNLGEIKRMADEVIEDMMREPIPEGINYANAYDFTRHIKRTKSSKGKEAMIKEAQHLKGVAVSPNCFDSNPDLLNVINGTFDLGTGQLCAHDSEDMITKLAPVVYDVNAKCPLWEAFVTKVFNGNEELIRFFKTSIGYSLTGHNQEQCMFILYGDGQNGKSTAVETIMDIMGDYAISASPETFLARDRSGSATPDIVRLNGARFVSTTEPQEGGRLNESLIKQMTGNDTITARALYSKAIQFKPVFKLWMTTNHKPMVSGTDEGIWRRIRLIPFTCRIPENQRDKNLPHKLRSEASGILNWMIEGHQLYRRFGLVTPKVVLEATLEYRSEMDMIARFIIDCLIDDSSSSVRSCDLYHCFNNWLKENGILRHVSQAKFSRDFGKRIPAEHTRTGSVYKGCAFSETGTYLCNK